MAHEWHTNQSKNILRLINGFLGFSYQTDHSGTQEISEVKVTKRVFSDEDAAISFVCAQSYGGKTAYLAACTTKKLTKGYQNAFANFLEKYEEYVNFKKNLTIAYGRTSAKATCPDCKSSISLAYGRRFRACPVCGSSKIISDSNWKTLDTKKKMLEKASLNLEKEAEKNDVTFICGIEWHC